MRLALRPFLPETRAAAQQPVTPTDIVGVQKPALQSKAPAPAASASAAAGKPPADSKAVPGVMVVRGTKIE